MLISHPPTLTSDPADWWEIVAKPACRIFCQKLSKLLAHRRRETLSLLRAALQAALAAKDWPTAATIKERIKTEDTYRHQGAVTRARLPNISGDEEDIFALASESGRPPMAATKVRTAWPTEPGQPPSKILNDQHEIEAEIVAYFEALFNGCHVATPAAPEPVDSGQSFVPDMSLVPDFTTHLPRLTEGQSESLEAPSSCWSYWPP